MITDTVRRDLPSGTVTFLFTDVEGSTKLLHELGAEGYAEALAVYRRILREAFAVHGGVEVDTQGDAFFVAFPTAPGALAAAAQALEGLSPGPIRLRMGIHTGTPYLAEEGYVGADVHRAARIAACGHGGQVLVSAATARLLETSNSLLQSASLRDLGEHRLKDLSAPERIYQFGDEEFPPLASLHQTNLPIPATPFLGRERELSEVGALLAREDVRLLTLMGPGGTGKTRLGLQAVAAAAERYPHGVWWVPLAPVRDPQLVLEAAGQALGAKDGLAEHIGDRSLLLLFDNFEQVVEAAEDVAGLIGSCPNLHLLVTSRELLRIPGEQAYPVPPLEPQEGTELFLARARAALPTFESSTAVPELCARLEHLPLALELAAAWVRVLSPEHLLERLSQRLDLLRGGRGVDPRQQTLRATIEWSHDLLDEGEQRLFARLAVFRGGSSLETAEEVCEADLDTLQSLVDKSLVRIRERDRFWMLETIREYADERLEESGEGEELRRRHAEHFLVFAEEAGLQMFTPGKAAAHDRIAREYPNVRAALERWRAASESEPQVRVATSIWRFWLFGGFLGEGRQWLEPLLSAAAPSPALRQELLFAAGHLAHAQGEIGRAVELCRESADVARQLDEPIRLGRSLIGLAGALAWWRDSDEVDALLAEAEALFASAGAADIWLAGLVWNRANIALIRHDYAGAAELSARAAELSRRAGDDRGLSISLNNLATANAQLGRHAEALAGFREALRLASDSGDLHLLGDRLRGIAAVYALEGDVERAARLLGAAERLRETIEHELEPAERDLYERASAALDAADRDRVQAALAAGRAMDLREAVEYALTENDA